MSSKADKPVGEPVFTWRGHMRDLVDAIQAMKDPAELQRIADVAMSLYSMANGRRAALKGLELPP